MQLHPSFRSLLPHEAQAQRGMQPPQELFLTVLPLNIIQQVKHTFLAGKRAAAPSKTSLQFLLFLSATTQLDKPLPQKAA